MELEKREWSNLSSTLRKQLLVYDDVLEQIISISNEGFKLARAKKTNNNTICY